MAAVSCKKCGRELASSARWCPDCGTPLGKTVRCRSCGKEISVFGKGCHHCGARGAAAYGPISYAIFVGFILVALLIVGLVYSFNNRELEQQQQQMEQDRQQREREQQEWRKQNGFER
jgi:double zinc ribbon protein